MGSHDDGAFVASQTSVSLKDVNGEAAGRISAEKCLRGAGTRKKLDPGSIR